MFRDTITVHVKKALYLACDACRYIGEASDIPSTKLVVQPLILRSESGAVAAALHGLAELNLARSLYLAKCEEGENDTLEELFEKFDEFINEVI